MEGLLWECTIVERRKLKSIAKRIKNTTSHQIRHAKIIREIIHTSNTYSWYNDRSHRTLRLETIVTLNLNYMDQPIQNGAGIDSDNVV